MTSPGGVRREIISELKKNKYNLSQFFFDLYFLTWKNYDLTATICDNHQKKNRIKVLTVYLSPPNVTKMDPFRPILTSCLSTNQWQLACLSIASTPLTSLSLQSIKLLHEIFVKASAPAALTAKVEPFLRNQVGQPHIEVNRLLRERINRGEWARAFSFALERRIKQRELKNDWMFLELVATAAHRGQNRKAAHAVMEWADRDELFPLRHRTQIFLVEVFLHSNHSDWEAAMHVLSRSSADISNRASLLVLGHLRRDGMWRQALSFVQCSGSDVAKGAAIRWLQTLGIEHGITGMHLEGNHGGENTIAALVIGLVRQGRWEDACTLITERKPLGSGVSPYALSAVLPHLGWRRALRIIDTFPPSCIDSGVYASAVSLSFHECSATLAAEVYALTGPPPYSDRRHAALHHIGMRALFGTGQWKASFGIFWKLLSSNAVDYRSMATAVRMCAEHGLWLETLSIIRNADRRNLNQNILNTAVQTCHEKGPDVSVVWLANRVKQLGLQNVLKW